MLPRADLTGTRPPTRVEAILPTTAAGDARQETFNRFNQIAIGKQLQAAVLSRLSDGTFLVRVADTSARMALPAGTRTGEKLDLTLISREPRPTFLLGRQSESNSATASLSPTGRLINNLLQRAQQQGVPMTLVGKTPLLSSSAASTPQIAAALHGALALSGLFYESHVGQWANGARRLADLLREPQARNGATRRLPKPDRNAFEPFRPADLEAEAAAGEDADADDAGAGRQISPLGAEASRLVSMQLDVLEQRRVLWQGELWPGQPLEWEVSEETPHQDQEDGARTWISTVRFELPTLGAVSATIQLEDGRIRIQARAANEAAAASLRTHGDLLAGALEAAGSSLDMLTVKQDEPV